MWFFSKQKQKKRGSILKHMVTAPAQSRFVRRKKRVVDILFLDVYQKVLRFSSRFVSKGVLLATLSLTVFGTAFGIVLFSNFFQVKNVAILRDSPLIPVEKYQESLSDLVGRNLLFVDGHDIQSFLLHTYPELHRVRVRKIFPETLQVQVQIHTIFSRLKVLGGADEFFLTSNGMVLKNETGAHIDQVSNDLPLLELPLYEELSQEDRQTMVSMLGLHVGGRFLSAEQVALISYTLDLFKKNFHYEVEKIIYRPLEKEIWMVLRAGTILFITLEPLEKGTIDTQLFKLKQDEGELSLDKGEMAYVDLRIVDKILFCQKGKQCASFVKHVFESVKK